MSKVKDLEYDIQEMYIDGMSAKTIALTLEIPIDWVLTTIESFGCNDIEEDTSPYATINS